MRNTALNRVGHAVRHARLRQGLTQAQLAELTGTSYTYISSLERGQRNITIKTLDKIAQAYHVDLFQIFQFDADYEGLEDDFIDEILAVLAKRKRSDRQMVLNIIREMFRSG